MTWAYYPLSTIPQSYDLVWCRFPEHLDLGKPGPKARPALVRASSYDEEGNGYVEVVYGTTNLKTDSRVHDFVVSNMADMDACGLYRATRFDLDNCVELPWAAEWFAPLPGTQDIVIGRLTDHQIKLLQIIISYRHRS